MNFYNLPRVWNHFCKIELTVSIRCFHFVLNDDGISDWAWEVRVLLVKVTGFMHKNVAQNEYE